MIKLIKLQISLLLLGIGCVWPAQTLALTPQTGTVELCVSGNVEGTEVTYEGTSIGRSRTEWSGEGALSVGYFVSRMIEIGVSSTFVGREGFPGAARIAGQGIVNLPTSDSVLPFVGIQLGSSINVYGDRHPFQWGVFAGIKSFLTDRAAIAIGPYYVRESIDISGPRAAPRREETLTYSAFGLRAGVSVFLGK